MGAYERAVALLAEGRVDALTCSRADQATVALAQAILHVRHSNLEAADAACGGALTLLEGQEPSSIVDPLVASALTIQGDLACARGHLERAGQAYQASGACWERASQSAPVGSPGERNFPTRPGGTRHEVVVPVAASLARMWHNRASVALLQGTLQQAQVWELQSRALFEQVGSHIGRAWSDMMLGDIAQQPRARSHRLKTTIGTACARWSRQASSAGSVTLCIT